jgi:hypothetical protein
MAGSLLSSLQYKAMAADHGAMPWIHWPGLDHAQSPRPADGVAILKLRWSFRGKAVNLIASMHPTTELIPSP